MSTTLFSCSYSCLLSNIREAKGGLSIFRPTFLIFKKYEEAYDISLQSVSVYIAYFFRFLCGPCRIKESRRFVLPRTSLTDKETLHRAESFLRSRQSLSYSRISQQFTEPEGSLPCSQESTVPILSHIDQIHIPLRFILILSSHRRLCLHNGLFFFWISHQYPISILFLTHVLYIGTLRGFHDNGVVSSWTFIFLRLAQR
jgi:hypothetical protein